MKFLFITFFALISLSVDAQALKISTTESTAAFKIKNLGITVNGTIGGLQGNIIFNAGNPASSIFHATAAISTIYAVSNGCAEHLKSPDFFDVNKYPVIDSVGTKVTSKGNNIYSASAVCTMHGVSKKIEFDFTASPKGNGYLFTAGFSLNRRDYGVGGKTLTLGDDVDVKLSIVAYP